MFLKKFFSLLVFAVILVPAICLAAEKPRVAVIPFVDQSPKKGIVLEGDIDTIRDDIANEIDFTGKFRAFTRNEVDKLLASIKFDNSDLVDPATAAQYGKMIGVQYLVLGTVNGFKSNKKGDYTAYLSVRMIEVETAEIFYSGRGEGKSNDEMIVALKKAANDALNGKRGMLTMMRGRK